MSGLAKKGFHINRKGYQETLNGPDAFYICNRIGASMAGRLGAGYTFDTIYGQRRVHTRVKTTGGGVWKERKTHVLRDTFPGSP